MRICVPWHSRSPDNCIFNSLRTKFRGGHTAFRPNWVGKMQRQHRIRCTVWRPFLYVPYQSHCVNSFQQPIALLSIKKRFGEKNCSARKQHHEVIGNGLHAALLMDLLFSRQHTYVHSQMSKCIAMRPITKITTHSSFILFSSNDLSAVRAFNGCLGKCVCCCKLILYFFISSFADRAAILNGPGCFDARLRH